MIVNTHPKQGQAKQSKGYVVTTPSMLLWQVMPVPHVPTPHGMVSFYLGTVPHVRKNYIHTFIYTYTLFNMHLKV